MKRLLLLMASVALLVYGNNQYDLEQSLVLGCSPRDNLMDVENVAHERNRDALHEFQSFFAKGWTTNQFITGLMLAVTNDYSHSDWSEDERRNIAARAAWKLGEINRPEVTNFFYRLSNMPVCPCPGMVLPSLFRYTNLEPEIMSYLRSQCVKTNMYVDAVEIVPIELLDALETMPDALKPAATNRVAQYMYYSIGHTTREMIWQDDLLADFLPQYSNSFQRLRIMRHISATSTNNDQRTWARQELDRLSSLPTNALNNIHWIEHASSGSVE